MRSSGGMTDDAAGCTVSRCESSQASHGLTASAHGSGALEGSTGAGEMKSTSPASGETKPTMPLGGAGTFFGLVHSRSQWPFSPQFRHFVMALSLSTGMRGPRPFPLPFRAAEAPDGAAPSTSSRRVPNCRSVAIARLSALFSLHVLRR